MHPRRAQFNQASLLVVIVGLVVTAALSIGAEVSYAHNQRRLTSLQTGLTGYALGAAPVQFERRLSSVVGVVANSSDPSQSFRRLIAPSMKPAGPFASASLIQLKADEPTLLVHLGIPSIRNVTGTVATRLYLHAARSGALVTSRAVAHGIQKLGYMMAATGSAGTFVVSGAQSLPLPDVVSIGRNSPDSGLNIAIYFGSAIKPSNLVLSTNTRLPFGGPVSKAVVAFGTSVLTLVASPRTALPGALSAALPWAIAAVGVALTIVIAVLVERLVRRRSHAEDLAAENERLFEEQRNVAVTLQRALLPQEFPDITGFEFASRYVPGTRRTEVGGDWYGIVKEGDNRCYFVVGDVSGRGIEAAALMAKLRFTIPMLASLGYGPADILQLASNDVDVGQSGHFATVLVGLIEDRQKLTVASAGHFAPLLINGDSADFVSLKVGVPLGVGTPSFDVAVVPLPASGTLVGFTDGLVEIRSAAINQGLDHLRRVATSQRGSKADDLVSAIMNEMIPNGSEDDTALLAIKWSANSRPCGPDATTTT
jgi:serine phosphatase RsbU (regulator of sigma subunit)